MVDSRFNIDFILKSLEIILTRNVFYFDGTHYLQTKGISMGTKVAPTLATLVLGFLEETLYERTAEKYGQDFSTTLRNDWKRFLDDCFIIWNNDVDTLPLAYLYPIYAYHTRNTRVLHA